LPVSAPLDTRRHAYRPDLAAASLQDLVPAPRYVDGEPRQVVHASTPLRAEPNARSSWTTEVLFGERVTVFEEKDGWAWVQLARDGYVGYMRPGAISAQVKPTTHIVRALGTFLYPTTDVKAPPWLHLGMTCEVSVAEMGATFARLADGSFIPARHIAEVGRYARDFAGVAERFLGTPYLWGGKTRLGLDCSGLVQVALHAAGIDCPRDSDMQQAELGASGEVRDTLDGLQRGDLVFWKGHVGIMMDAFLLLHANAHHMGVAIEPLRAAVDRNLRAGLLVTAVKRLPAKSA
jgi:cell wall-associated NlpC family hydrolase